MHVQQSLLSIQLPAAFLPRLRVGPIQGKLFSFHNTLAEHVMTSAKDVLPL